MSCTLTHVIPPATITKALAVLRAARYPEAVFGPDPACIKVVHRDWAKVCHEDMVKTADKPKAHDAFILLAKLLADAEAKVMRGTYGDNRPAIMATLRTKTATYELVASVGSTDIADLYQGTSDRGTPVLVKVVRAPANNDLMRNEADILAALPATLDPKHTAYFPNLIDSFEAAFGKTKRRVNVFNWTEGAVTLEEVAQAYPKGLDAKDAAWMWNRQLEALHLLHGAGYIHANVTPDRFIVVPETHVGCLIDLCYAVKLGAPAKALSSRWSAFYPPELPLKKGLDTGADLYASAKCMNHLLGGSLRGIPVALSGLIRSCWLGAAHRTKDAEEVYRDFKAIRKAAGWPSVFRPFAMPTVAPLSSVSV